MSAPLDEWQARLDRHFAGLRAERGARPLFALEHGLATEDIDALSTAIRAHVRSSSPSILHALPWIVYAAEVGYGYEGDEYWQTFEQKTPFWTVRGTREWIRDRYEWFAKKYGGAAPSGPWATQFSIICWPITHAILPTDLQRQLAHILYDLRDSFSAELFESPTTLGEFIAARSFNATSRFKKLTQEPQLIGQIAAALLLQGQFGTAGLLHPAALRRIGADLERDSPYSVPRTGGLYVARLASSAAAVIVSPIVEGLSDFGCTPRVANVERTLGATHRVLSLAELWSQAKLSGNVFASTRQHQVLTAIDALVAGRLRPYRTDSLGDRKGWCRSPKTVSRQQDPHVRRRTRHAWYGAGNGLHQRCPFDFASGRCPVDAPARRAGDRCRSPNFE